MNREECETLLVQKLKEIKDIAKEYDKSEELYLSISINDDSISITNPYWKTETPLDVIEFNDGTVMHFDN